MRPPQHKTPQPSFVQEALSRLQRATEQRRMTQVRRSLRARLRAGACLGGLAGVAALSVPAVWAVAWAARPPAPRRLGRTALVTGVHMSKGLHLCRHLHAAGYQVVAVETPPWWMAAARLSRSVAAFETVPSPGDDGDGYIEAMLALVHKYQATWVGGSASPNHSLYDGLLRAALPASCHSLAVPAELMAQLDDKWRFTQLCQSLSLPVPHARPIVSRAQLMALNAEPDALVGQHLLKSITYDPVLRTAPIVLPCAATQLQAQLQNITMDAQHPWILQQMLDGPEYSTYGIAHRGRLVAYADTVASLSNLRYRHVGSQAMRAWMTRLCAATQLDGQVCIDFMADAAGTLKAIECNPRASTVLTCFHDQPDFVRALIAPETLSAPVLPKADSPGQFWLVNELFAGMWQGDAKAALTTLQTGRDALFTAADPAPFLGMHGLQIPVQLLRRIRDGRAWTKIDFNIGKLSQPGGD